MSFEALHDDWVVWNEEPEGRVILVFRPDVFTEDHYPAACLPTIYLTNGSRRRRPGAGQYATDEWHVVCFLEPDVELLAETYDERQTAVEAATDVATRFAQGELDFRGAYQIPRAGYLDRLDDLTE